MTLLSAPDLKDVLSPASVPAYPFSKSYEDAVNDPFAVFQTGGSTGLPKTIKVTHGWLEAFDLQRTVAPVDGQPPNVVRRREGDRQLWGFPPFHAGGMIFTTVESVFQGTVLLRDPVRAWPLTTEGMLEILESGKVTTFTSVPNLLEELVLIYPRAMELFKDMTYICYAGGTYTFLALSGHFG